MKVMLFNHAVFQLSETFIYKQVKGMPPDVEIDLYAFDIVHENHFPLSNKKFRVQRRLNSLDRVLTGIRKHVFRVRYKLGVLSAGAVKKKMKEAQYDLVHAHFGFNALLVFPLARALNIPLVVTFHGLDASPQMLKKRKYRLRVKEMLDYASAVIIVSPHMKETLGLSKIPDRTYLIPCGVDAAEFTATDKQTDKKTINIIHSGRLVSKKGVPDLIRVFGKLSHKYNNIRLSVIGDGPEAKFSTQLAEDAAFNSVRFHGAKPHEEVKKFMRDADIFVLNSRVGKKGDMEGLPVSLLEAMSMKLPVVSTRHAGIPQAITDGVDGLLVNENDNDALYIALERLIVDEQLRTRIGEAARAKVVSGFTDEETNRKILDVYRRVTGKLTQTNTAFS